MRFNIWPLIESHRALSVIALTSAVASVAQCTTGIVDFEKISLSKGKVVVSPKVELTPTSVSNLLDCLGNTGGEQRHIQLSGCLDGVSLPATTTAQQIIDILGTIPRDSTQWHDDLVDLLKNNKITISGEDATRLLSTFGSESRRSYLIGILCYIKRPISDSDKNELLKGIDPMYVSYVRQQLAEPTNLPCEN